MSQYESVFSEEQHKELVLRIYYDYVKTRRLSKLGIRGVARELQEEQDDDGNYVWVDQREETKGQQVKFETLRQHVQRIVANWRPEMREFMRYELIEAVASHAEKAADSPASLKAIAPIIEPETKHDTDKLAISQRDRALLQRGAVATKITIGKAIAVEGDGDTGHECPDTVHLMADGQRQDITIETISFGDDSPVRGVHQGRHPAQGSPVPDTEVPPEDAVDNDCGDDMGLT